MKVFQAQCIKVAFGGVAQTRTYIVALDFEDALKVVRDRDLGDLKELLLLGNAVMR